MKKRVNPHRKPISKADVDRAKKEVMAEALNFMWSVVFTVLRDKEGYDLDGLQRIWDEVESLSNSVASGYCTVSDLKHILKIEEGAVITK